MYRKKFHMFTAALAFAAVSLSAAAQPSSTNRVWPPPPNPELVKKIGEFAARNTDRINSPTPVVTATEIAAGYGHTCVIVEEGEVRCWGGNDTGQLGDGTKTDSFKPVYVKGLKGAKSIALGTSHSCVIIADGTVKCWGYNYNGELGDGTTEGRTTPVAVKGLTDVVQIALGANHTCARDSRGAVKCWGINKGYELGFSGPEERSLTPVEVPGVEGATFIAVGYSHSCAIVAKGEVMCWGANHLGQLGNGEATTAIGGAQPGNPPIKAKVYGEAFWLALGINHSCARITNLGVQCWGHNLLGQVGDGTNTPVHLKPYLVPGQNDAVRLFAGGFTTCVLVHTIRYMRCWGDNRQGQIGDGTIDDALIASKAKPYLPTTVKGLNFVSRVAIGSAHTCVIETSTAVKCWGANWQGQLGDETNVTRPLPRFIPD